MATALSTIARQHVEVTDLGGGMVALWAQIESSDELPLCRALTLNLIAISDPDGEAEVRESVERLLNRHACRAFVVVIDDAAAEASARLAAKVRCEGRGRQTCLEEIALTAPSRSFALLPGLIRPLLINDIPTHLYWARAMPANSWEIATMSRLADSTVVNSNLFADPVGDLARLSELAEGHVVDLASFRQRPWRRALAQAFETFSWSSSIPTRCVVEHGEAPSATAAAQILGAWLGERLDAAVELVPVNARAGTEAGPQSLELWHGEAHVRIQAQSEVALRMMVTLGDRCLLPVDTPASRGQLGDLLAAAVDSV